MLMTYRQLRNIVEAGIVRGGTMEHINGSSIDVHLAGNFMVEKKGWGQDAIIDVARRDRLAFHDVTVGEGHYYSMPPGQFLLASTIETFYLPDHLSALFVMKSSVARCGLDQMNAAWCSPGWTGSALTLELSNITEHYTLLLRPGMAIGQMLFFQGDSIPHEVSYKNRGAFNNQPTVAASK